MRPSRRWHSPGWLSGSFEVKPEADAPAIAAILPLALFFPPSIGLNVFAAAVAIIRFWALKGSNGTDEEKKRGSIEGSTPGN